MRSTHWMHNTQLYGMMLWCRVDSATAGFPDVGIETHFESKVNENIIYNVHSPKYSGLNKHANGFR